MQTEGCDSRRTGWWVLAISVLVYLAGMLLMSAYTSPLYPYHYGYDSAIFSLIGKSITQGRIVYRDLFDHKGPLLFLLEALGWWLGGSTGIFGLQCVLGTVTLAFFLGIWKIRHPVWNAATVAEWITCFAAVYAYFFVMFERGNLSEEHSLPFIACSLYFLVRYAAAAQTDHPLRYAFVHGVCVAAIALIRLNNAICICAGILAVGIRLLVHRRYVNIVRNVLFGLLGMAVVFVPVVGYFALHGALEEMIYGAFLFNFRYSGTVRDFSIVSGAEFWLRYVPAAVSLVFLVSGLRRRTRFENLMLSAVLLSAVASLIHTNVYRHYFVVFVPVFMLLCSTRPAAMPRVVRCALLVACAVFCLHTSLPALRWDLVGHLVYDQSTLRHETIADTLSVIPPEERDSVIGYGVEANIYLEGDLIPCYRYYTLQNEWSRHEPSIKKDFFAWLEQEGALWLMTPCEENEEDPDGMNELERITNERYELYAEDEYLKLYRRTDETQ